VSHDAGASLPTGRARNGRWIVPRVLSDRLIS
jgi:hypothetical protein